MMRAPALYRAEGPEGVAGAAHPQPAAGGQRMALKLAACGPPNYALTSAGPQPPQQQSADCHRELPAESDCSCSDSLECLSQQQPPHSPVGRRMEPANCAFMNPPHLAAPPQHHRRQQQLSPQQQQHLDHLNQLHNQHSFHRPLMPHYSVPPYHSSSAPAEPPHPQPAPHPPPLVRQSTYKLTPDTITDCSLGVDDPQIPRSPPPPPNLEACQVVPVLAGADCDFLAKPPESAGGQKSKQRPTVSFRRSHTADQRAALYRQPSRQSQNPNQGYKEAADNQNPKLERPHKSQLTRHRSALPSTSSGRGFEHKPVQEVGGPQPSGSCTMLDGSLAGNPLQQFGLRAGCPASAASQPAPAAASNPMMTTHFPPASPAASALGARAANHLLAFDGISLPAISSHRTNSPWMRISSIILTPIGIVIILFIVVSPLLHYLM